MWPHLGQIDIDRVKLKLIDADGDANLAISRQRRQFALMVDGGQQAQARGLRAGPLLPQRRQRIIDGGTPRGPITGQGGQGDLKECAALDDAATGGHVRQRQRGGLAHLGVGGVVEAQL